MRRAILILPVIVLFALLIAQVGSAQTAQAWAPNTYYAVGALVTYNGVTYKCLQAHTSLVGWEPPNVPALWAVYSGTVSTATRAATSSGPTATRTRTVTPGGPTAT